MLSLICTIIVLLFLWILIPTIFIGSGASSLFMSVLTIVILVLIVVLISRVVKSARKKSNFTYRKGAVNEKAVNEKLSKESTNEEDQEYVRIYAGKASLPTDALKRSAYIAWLAKEGHYEEADRISSM